MGVEAAVLVIGAVTGVAGAVEQRKQTKRAEKRADESDQLKMAQQRLQAARARKQQMARLREAQAANIAMAEAQGTSGASSTAGALSGLASQAGSNIGFASQLEAADRGQFSLGRDINKAASAAQNAGQVSNLGFSVAQGAFQSMDGFAGAKQALKDTFGGE